MASKKAAQSQYQRLVAGFAASAFVLLGTLSAMQYEANTATAAVISKPVITTKYTTVKCMVKTTKRDANGRPVYRVCRAK